MLLCFRHKLLLIESIILHQNNIVLSKMVKAKEREEIYKYYSHSLDKYTDDIRKTCEDTYMTYFKRGNKKWSIDRLTGQVSLVL